MSGWRLRDSSAPGTATAAPWSPPMASSAMRTLWGMARQYRVSRRTQQGSQSPLLAAPTFFQRGQRGERLRKIIPHARRLEYGAWLARIGIDAENEEFGRHRAEIDRPVHERFRRILERNFNFSPIMFAARRGGSGYEDEVNRLVDLVFHRLPRYP